MPEQTLDDNMTPRCRRISPSAQTIPGAIFASLSPTIEAARAKGTELIALHIGDTFLMPPVEARLSAQLGDDPSGALYAYGDTAGSAPLKASVLAFLARHGRGDGLSSQHITVTAGATHALYTGARTLFSPGDEVLVAAPYWPLSVGVLQAAGATPIAVPLTSGTADHPGTLSPQDIEQRLTDAVTPNVRAVYVTSPNNPDGFVWTQDALRALGRVASHHDLWVLFDEVYADLCYDTAFVSPSAIPGLSERTLRVLSVSKSHGLAGARVGMLVANDEVTRVAQRVATHTLYNVPAAMTRCAESALSSGDAWLAEARATYRRARDESLAALTAIGFQVRVPEGGAYIFLDLRPLLASGESAAPLLRHCIEHGVLLAPGEAFGQHYAGWARLCFTKVPLGPLREGLLRLSRAIASYRA